MGGTACFSHVNLSIPEHLDVLPDATSGNFAPRLEFVLGCAVADTHTRMSSAKGWQLRGSCHAARTSDLRVRFEPAGAWSQGIQSRCKHDVNQQENGAKSGLRKACICQITPGLLS